MRWSLFIAAALVLYLALIGPFTTYMNSKPFVEKIGYVPEPGIVRLLAADQSHLTAALLIMKVVSYYGSLVELAANKVAVSPEYYGMFKMLDTGTRLDPYNMDAYYFTQAIILWRTGKVREVNELLERGMKYRDWDFYLPSFAGFNYAYFLKDYTKASENYRRVADLTGDTLSMNLAGRYLYESGSTELAISYLTSMVKSARNDAVKKTLQTRLKAFLEVARIEKARDRFHAAMRRMPRTVDELMQKGYLAAAPVDPYGGVFFLDGKGVVRSTSKFAFGTAEHAR